MGRFVGPMCLQVPVLARVSLADNGQVHRAVAVTVQQRGSQITYRAFRTWPCRAWCLKEASKAGCPRRVNIWNTCKNMRSRSGENRVVDRRPTDDWKPGLLGRRWSNAISKRGDQWWDAVLTLLLPYV